MEEQNIKAFLVEENPSFDRKDIQRIKFKDKDIMVTIKNIYSRKLEDLTFDDLNMLGYTNPNTFVKEWVKNHEVFDKNKNVWVVIYMENKK